MKVTLEQVRTEMDKNPHTNIQVDIEDQLKHLVEGKYKPTRDQVREHIRTVLKERRVKVIKEVIERVGDPLPDEEHLNTAQRVSHAAWVLDHHDILDEQDLDVIYRLVDNQ